jgi:LysM repeat protein
MTRFTRFAAILGLAAATATAQDAPNPAEELAQLRKAVELQARQIQALTEQVAKLAASLENKTAAAPAADAPDAAPAPAPGGKEEFNTADAPKAEPAQPRHIVVKGETLTSIAKHYNVPLADLMKANKGLNERKIQIGQSILLPSATPSPSTPAPTEPKPNP